MDNTTNFDNIYTFKNVTFSTYAMGTATQDWCVSSIEVVLAENGIPRIEVRVDPAHAPTDKPSTTNALGLATLEDWNKRAQLFAELKATASLTFEVWKKDVLDQSFSVKDWIVTEAGMSTSHDAFAVVLVIQHPAVLTNFYGTSISGVLTPTELMVDSFPSDDLVVAIASILELYGTCSVSSLTSTLACTTENELDEANIASIFTTEMMQLAKIVRDTFVYNEKFYQVTYSNWPTCLGALAANVADMPFSLSSYFWGLRDTNVWEIIAQQLPGQWFVSILPTYWDKLTITPTTPWALPTIMIDDKDIAVASLPPYERNIIAGVTIYTQGPDTGQGYGAYQGYGSDELLVADGVTYRPNSTLKGAIEVQALPHWLTSLSKASASEAGQYGAMGLGTSEIMTPSNTQLGISPNVSTGVSISPSAENMRCAAYRCAKQFFLTQYKSGTQAHLTTRLMLAMASNDNTGEKIIPGKSCRITSAGQSIMDFYITMVVHRIDFAQATAETVIAGKYVRPSSGLVNSIDTTQSIPNPVWE